MSLLPEFKMFSSCCCDHRSDPLSSGSFYLTSLAHCRVHFRTVRDALHGKVKVSDRWNGKLLELFMSVEIRNMLSWLCKELEEVEGPGYRQSWCSWHIVIKLKKQNLQGCWGSKRQNCMNSLNRQRIKRRNLGFYWNTGKKAGITHQSGKQ